MNILQKVFLKIASFFNWIAGNQSVENTVKYNNLSEDLYSLKNQLDDANADRRALHKKNQELKETILALKETHTPREKYKNDNYSRFVNAQQIDAMKKLINKINSERVALREKLKGTQDPNEGLKETIALLREEIQTLKEEHNLKTSKHKNTF